MPNFHSSVISRYQRGGKGGKGKVSFNLPSGWPKSGQYKVGGVLCLCV
jgi:hypothetical protein